MQLLYACSLTMDTMQQQIITLLELLIYTHTVDFIISMRVSRKREEQWTRKNKVRAYG